MSEPQCTQVGGLSTLAPEEAVHRIEQRLFSAHFDFGHPDLLVAWKVFQDFSEESVSSDESYLLFQAGDFSTKDNSYVDFCREFKRRDADNPESPWYEQIHMEFTTEPTLSLSGNAVEMWSYGFLSHQDFFANVAASSKFQAALAHTRWSFQVWHTGV